jgi:hypothetical protein
VTRVASLAILFVALTDFGVERARFDLWIVTAALVALLWNILGRRFRAESQKHDHTSSMTRSEQSQMEGLRSDSSVLMQRKPTS